MPLADVHGIGVHYEVTGNGTPLLLLLPQSTGPAGRHKLIDALAQYHSVIRYDQRGTGCSAPVSEGLTIATLAADAIDLLDTLDVGHVHLVCHSTGCGIGMTVAARHPDRVAGLVLTAPWTHADLHLSTMQTLRKAAARALDPEQYARFNASVLFPPTFRRADESGFARLTAAASANPQDAAHITRYLDAILAFDARPLWPAIRCPAMVTVAEDDQLMPPWFAVETARGIRGSQLIRFAGGGHMLPETRTEEFVTAVLVFLESIKTSESTNSIRD